MDTDFSSLVLILQQINNPIPTILKQSGMQEVYKNQNQRLFLRMYISQAKIPNKKCPEFSYTNRSKIKISYTGANLFTLLLYYRLIWTRIFGMDSTHAQKITHSQFISSNKRNRVEITEFQSIFIKKLTSMRQKQNRL